jgi:hypothetical protein
MKMSIHYSHLGPILGVWVLGACLATSAGAIDFETTIDTEAAGRWMADRENPRSRAAALALETASPDEHALDAHSTIEAIARILHEDQDPVTLSLLALSCMQAELENDCIELGLDQAIVQYDRANLMVRGHLLADDPDAFQQAMREAERLDDRVFDMAVVVNDQLRAYAEAMGLGPLGSETQAMAFAMAWALPALGPLSEACRTTSPEQVAVCERLAAQAAESKSSLITRMLDWSIRKQLAEAAGRTGEVAALEAKRRQMNARFVCLQSSIPPDYWMELDGSTYEAHLIEAAEHGEWAAVEMLATQFGIDCQTVPSN